jgi:RNA polymerase sigma-70 factor (ECF subfamily)
LADSTFSFDLAASSWDDSPDALLLEGLRTGDERSYEELVQRFQHPVYNLVYRLATDPGDAADIVQEVFLKVFRGIGSFRGQCSLKTWIYRIAVNEAHNNRRRFSRKRGHEVGLDEDQGEGLTFDQVLPDHSPSPFDVASDQETHAAIEAALQRIKPNFRSALVLREVEGLSYEEIADVLQVNLGTVKTRILRGREALRQELNGRLQQSSSDQKPEFSVVGAE